jgi:hypothetical protein
MTDRMLAGHQKFPADSQPASPYALADAARFLRQHWLLFCGISAVVLTPCFWQRRIQAGDLASHVYNAWLAQLIERGQAPGLWIARQWNNVLFDIVLAALGNRFGLAVAEKIAVSVAVLIFFWGSFALASAAARRAAWFVLPCLAMVAYGWTFQMGFLNYYLSLGLSFFGVALLWRGRGWERAAALALVPLIWMAHPLGVVFLACAGAWVVVAEKAPMRSQLFAGVAAVVLLVSVRLYILAHYPVFWSLEPRYHFNGSDQLLLYGPQYRLPMYLLLAFMLLSVLADVIRRRSAGERWISCRAPAQLYGLALLTVLLLPAGIVLPQYAAPAGFLHERLSCICAVLACCLLATMKPQKWHLAGFATAAAIFFFYLYADTAKINRMEEQAGRIQRTIPAGQRVLATIQPFVGSRIFIFHIVDRACIGYCFSYGNYEPASGQFRVRANPGNRFVTTSMDESFAIQKGEYTVQPQDLPMFQIYQCNVNMVELCMRELAAGDVNGRYGVQPSASTIVSPVP